MSLLRHVGRRLRRLFRRRQTEAEMAEEMRFHLEQRTADFAADGLADTEAHHAAHRKFGNVGSLQERVRDTWGWSWLERALKDFRFAFHQLTRAPGFTVLAIVTLALGIGANTAMFSVLNSILLKPLPYPDSAQLDRLYRTTAQNPEGHFSPADWQDFQQARADYGDAAAYTAAHASLSEPGQPTEMAYAGRSSLNFLSLLGVSPQLGRDFQAGEDTPGRDRVVILSQRTWINRFGGRPEVIGRTLRIDGEPHQIIGVLPATFNDWRHLGMIDFFWPLAFTPEQTADRHSTLLRIIVRRSALHSPAGTAGFIASFGARLAAEFPEANAGSSWRTVSLRATVVDRQGPIMMKMLVGLSGFVLLIACSNLANLYLARTMARAREFAVRAALGASRTQLLRPLIAESLLLSLAGGACGLLLALWFRDWGAVRSTGENGEQVFFALDGRVLAWAFGASLVTALAFGLAPALFALRLDLNTILKSGGRGVTGSRAHQRFGRILIIGQFALAMILLAGAGVFIRGLHDLNHRRSGWESERVVTGPLLLPSASYPGPEEISAFHRLALERLAALPGVASASLSAFTPFFNWPDTRRFFVEGRERPPAGHEPAAVVNTVSHQYFDTFGTRLLAGRTFAERDRAGAPRVYILSQSAARSLFGAANPIGRRLAPVAGEQPVWGEVVGVVSDVQSIDAEVGGITLQVYQPMAQSPSHRNELAVRTTGIAPSTLVDRIRTTMAELDPDLPVRKLQPADTAVARANYQLAVLRDILAAIALLGLGLASLGIYGIIARTMAQRTGEFAIRLALGASIENVMRLVLTSGASLALVGAALGLLGAIGVSHLIASSFPGMQMHSTGVLIGTALLLIAIALFACWLPARRAGRVDAIAVLRAE